MRETPSSSEGRRRAGEVTNKRICVLTVFQSNSAEWQRLLVDNRTCLNQAESKSTRLTRDQGVGEHIFGGNPYTEKNASSSPLQLGSLHAEDHRISSGANSLAQKTSGVSYEAAKLPTSWTTTFGRTRQQVLCALPTAFLNKHPRAAVQIFKNHKLNGEKC